MRVIKQKRRERGFRFSRKRVRVQQSQTLAPRLSIVERGFGFSTWKVNVRLPGTGNSNSHGARPVHQITSMIKWIWTSKFSITHSERPPSSKLRRSPCPEITDANPTEPYRGEAHVDTHSDLDAEGGCGVEGYENIRQSWRDYDLGFHPKPVEPSRCSLFARKRTSPHEHLKLQLPALEVMVQDYLVLEVLALDNIFSPRPPEHPYRGTSLIRNSALPRTLQ